MSGGRSADPNGRDSGRFVVYAIPVAARAGAASSKETAE